MNLSIETVVTLLTGIGVIAGIFSWWLSKFLSDKKESTELRIEVKYLKEDVRKLERDVEDLKNKNRNSHR